MHTLTQSSVSPDPAIGQAVAEVYYELREIAHLRLRKFHKTPTLLDTTSIVHESYLRFLKAGSIRTLDRAHFLAYSARVIRSVVVDSVRQRVALRRGGGAVRIELDDALADYRIPCEEREILRVHDALQTLGKVSERLAQVVEMRYFGGMSEAEIGEALGLTERTVRRDWDKARLLLAAALR